jgi:hypothetical protein
MLGVSLFEGNGERLKGDKFVQVRRFGVEPTQLL